MKARIRQSVWRLPVRIVLAVSLASSVVACGGGGVSVAPNTPATSSPTGIAALPNTNSFATSVTSAPTSTTRAAVITLPFTPMGGYGGKAALKVASIPVGIRLTVRYASGPPALVTPFSVKRAASVHRAVAFSDPNDRAISYTTITPSQALAFTGPPAFTFTLPAGFAIPSVNYYIALWTGTAWVEGFSDAATVVSTATATTITATGRYAPAVPASGNLQIALFARNASAGAPSPAPIPSETPAPIATGTPTPVATATPTPVATATPTPIATATPTHTPTPAPTPTPHISLSLTSMSFVSNVPQTVTVSETGYTGNLTQTNTCSGIATATPASAAGPSAVFTITPIGGGSCTVTFHDSASRTAPLSVGVTTISIPVQ